MITFHETVLLEKTVEYLQGNPGVYIDGTLGGGGHTHGLLSAYPHIRVLSIDRDPEALSFARDRLKAFRGRVLLMQENFKNIPEIVEEMGLKTVQGIVLDLGVSSHHLDTAKRGFSYQEDGPLDMRMDPGQSLTAAQVINTYSQKDLSRIIADFGEEKWSHRIASFLVQRREEKPLRSTGELVEVIKAAIPASARRGKGHPARRTFQALRIHVNEELSGLKETLEQCVTCLEVGGRIAVLTFHSLEDQIVRKVFRNLSRCQCPRNLPCQCQGPLIQLITTNAKPVVPDNEEIERNYRARSAKLRVAERLRSK